MNQKVSNEGEASLRFSGRQISIY